MPKVDGAGTILITFGVGQCEACDKKVDATRGIELIDLPQVKPYTSKSQTLHPKPGIEATGLPKVNP
jgi:hypothetical protein